MAAVRWSVKATNDLRTIVEYVSATSTGYASTISHKIVEATMTLESYQQIGRMMPEYQDGRIRELIVAPYRVIYTIDAQGVRIAAIVHGSRDLPRHLRAEIADA